MDLFELKIKYQEQVGDGRLASKTVAYIVEAFNYSDAEAIATEIADKYSFITPEIKSMKPVNYSDIFDSNDTTEDLWYKVSIKVLVDTDENGKEKWAKQTMLVKGSSIDSASKNLQAELSRTSLDYTSVVIQETKIVEVIKK